MMSSPSLVILVPFSFLVSCVVLALSPFTFGVLCIWVDAASSILAILFHGTILFLTLCRRRRNNHTLPSVDSGYADEKQQCISTFASPIPSATLSPVLPPPVYSPSTATKQKSRQCITPRPSISIMIPKYQGGHATVPRAPSRICEIGSDLLYNLWSIFTLAIVTTLCLVAFGKTIDTTIHGAQSSSVLPAERDGTPFPWNKSVQWAQSGLLGVQLVLTLIVLIMSLKGRTEKQKKLKRLQDLEEYMISP